MQHSELEFTQLAFRHAGIELELKGKLGWNPHRTTFEQLVKLMVEHDIAKVAAEGAAAKVRTNLAEYLEKGIVK